MSVSMKRSSAEVVGGQRSRTVVLPHATVATMVVPSARLRTATRGMLINLQL